MNMQDKFEKMMDDIAHIYKIECTIHHDFSNNGKMFFQESFKFKPLMVIEFNFQADYCSVNYTIMDKKYNDMTVKFTELDRLDAWVAEMSSALKLMVKRK
jgi:hypothetical protein